MRNAKFISLRLARAAAIMAIAGLVMAISAGTTTANHVTGGGQSFVFLQPGFTQDIFGVSQHFMGGVAFDPTDGDPWVDDCVGSGGHLHRYDAQSTPPPVHTVPPPGTSLHTESIHTSNAGCGLTPHSNGSLYSNLTTGVARLNSSTGAPTGGPFGPPGNALGISEDPETGNLVYVGSNGTLFFVNAALTTSGTFSGVTTGNFVDGVAFDPSGDFLFVSNRSPSFRLTILNGDTGALIQHVPMASEPDGISFHATTPKFVVTNNTNGTMTRFDFPADDYTMPPVQSVFASGGFRGDLSQVGADGCVYLTQAGTRYNNGDVTPENSLVRICGGFAPPGGPGPPAKLELEPATATNPVGTEHCLTATVTDAADAPVPGVTVRFKVTGSVNTTDSATTDANGEAEFCYTGPPFPGADVIHAYADTDNDSMEDVGEPSDDATKAWVLPVSTPGCEVKITNGGWIVARNGDKSSFGGNAKVDADGNVSGNEEYQDHGPADPMNLKGNVLVVVCTGTTQATIYGQATIDGSGSFFYRLNVEDNGEPGKGADKYWMFVENGYDSGNQTLMGGNVQIHKS